MKLIDQEFEKDLKGREKAEYRRLSGRTYEQFKKDIKQGHKNEKEIIERFAKFYKETTGKDLNIIDNGVDNSGEFLDVSQVKDDADYIVNGKPMEVKIIKDVLPKFRLKLNLIKSYIEQNANVLIVAGWETKQPIFTVLDKEKLEHMVKYGSKQVSGDWEGKPTVIVYRSAYEWRMLPRIS